MASSWQTLLIKCRYEPRFIIIMLSILRIAICFWPQTGYLHPDEFFQSVDITGGNYFNSKISPTWEFATDRPIRCMLIPTMLNSLAFKLTTLFKPKPSAYLLLVAPRLTYTLLSFVVDISLHKLCRYYSSRGLWYLPVSVIFQSSFICLGCMTRTLSNSVEVVIFSLLLVVVCHLIRPRFRILFVTPTRTLPAHEHVRGATQIQSSILIGFLTALGTFNRPTFPCFAIVPLIYWTAESLRRNDYDKRLLVQRILVPVTLSALTTSILISAFDTVYYNDISTLRDLVNYATRLEYDKFYSELRSNWVLTPVNFVLYNTNVKNLSNYGLHLPYTHMLVNVPLAFNVLGLIFYGRLVSLLVGSGVYRLIFSTHRVYALMLLSSLTSMILLSFIPHQEFRFLLPLIVPLAYAFAFTIYSSNKLLSLWLVFNLVLVYFYGAIHQSGVTRSALDLDPILKSRTNLDQGGEKVIVNVIALRCYLVPSYQWNIPNDDYRFILDLEDSHRDMNSSLSMTVGRVLGKQIEYPGHRHELYLMMPSLYEKTVARYLESVFFIDPSRLKPIERYALHFTGEDFGWSIENLSKEGLSSWRKAFGFSLMSLDMGTTDQNNIDDDKHSE